MQNKREAYWFYRFLSIFYDNYVNPFFWTEEMRDEALSLARLDHPDLKVLDVGAGTGFTTLGIVQYVKQQNVTLLDQSPHQLARAQRKPSLQGCLFIRGDAENLPFPDNTFDRYISAGSIEYWPHPEKAIREAFRVLKPGGRALIIGPILPENIFSRWLAELWMLFPEEEHYWRWFEESGFLNIQRQYVRPTWVRKEKYGIAIVGEKGSSSATTVQGNENWKPEEAASPPVSKLQFLLRYLVGLFAGFMFIPIAIWGNVRLTLRKLLARTSHQEVPEFSMHQIISLLFFFAFLLTVIIFLFRHI